MQGESGWVVFQQYWAPPQCIGPMSCQSKSSFRVIMSINLSYLMSDDRKHFPLNSPLIDQELLSIGSWMGKCDAWRASESTSIDTFSNCSRNRIRLAYHNCNAKQDFASKKKSTHPFLYHRHSATSFHPRASLYTYNTKCVVPGVRTSPWKSPNTPANV